MSGRLLASLFYIELETMPDASWPSQYCTVILQCRIPPGQPLVDLLYQLRRANSSYYYQGSGVNEIREELCTDADIWECEKGRPFTRRIIQWITSIEAEVHIAIDGLDGRKNWVSNCPYKIKQLIQDQQLDHVFGRRDRKCMNELWMKATEAEKDLMEALNNL